MSVLARILEAKREEIARLRASPPAGAPRAPLDVLGALRRAAEQPLRLIAEVKFRSPSAGALSTALDAATRAEAYARAGAAMVSVLCDERFFAGGWEHLAAARARCPALPLLAKEFVLDEAQIRAARAAGADAVLLIARIVDAPRLAALTEAALDAGLEPLVEVHDAGELASALATRARVIGVNARDLDTLAMDAARAAAILDAIPRDRVRVHLSGLKTADDVRAVSPRADAALIGEALMRQDDPAPLLRALCDAARG